VVRFKCSRAGCENRAKYQWSICADNNCYRPICADCDIELNKMVLDWMGFANADEMMERYREFVIGSIGTT
jgi:hypothetical protein